MLSRDNVREAGTQQLQTAVLTVDAEKAGRSGGKAASSEEVENRDQVRATATRALGLRFK